MISVTPFNAILIPISEYDGCLNANILKVSLNPMARCVGPEKQRKIIDNLPYFSGRSKTKQAFLPSCRNARISELEEGNGSSRRKQAKRRRNRLIPQGTEATSYEWIRDLIRNKRHEKIFCWLVQGRGKRKKDQTHSGFPYALSWDVPRARGCHGYR